MTEKVSDHKEIRPLSMTFWIVFNIKVDSGDIEKMYRLGRWSEDKARPLLIAFQSHELKREIMTNLRNLKETEL